MRSLFISVIVGLLLLTFGCNDNRETTAQLQKQVQALQDQLKKSDAAVDFDMQEKCAKDAKDWFKENWQPGKNTLLLTYSNHYSKGYNVCFIAVEYHSKLYTSPLSWSNQMSVWNVNENAKFADFAETHESSGVITEPLVTLQSCSVLSSKCKSGDEYASLIAKYMAN